jgi:hypothetical protein
MIIAMGKRGMTIRQIGCVMAMSQPIVLYGTPKRSPTTCRPGSRPAPATASTSFPHYPKPLDEWVTMVIPEQTAASSAPNTKARRSARIPAVDSAEYPHQAAIVQVNRRQPMTKQLHWAASSACLANIGGLAPS